MMLKSKVFILLVLLLLLLVSFDTVLAIGQQQDEELQTVVNQSKEGSGNVTDSPQNIKEETGIFVFVGWMWLSIIVLIFFLRLKIREADRLFHLNFFSSGKE
jgi:hypothetical protein